MLTRRQIRIKVMQSVYAFSHSEKGNVDEQLRFFEKKEYTPLSFTYIENRLNEIINDSEQVNFIIKYLKDKRETNTYLDIKRHHNK